MTPTDDRFEESRELGRALDRALEDLRKDVTAIVAEEVRRRGYSREELERLVAELARKELRTRRGAAEPILARWAPTLAAVGVVLLLFAGWWAWGRLTEGDVTAPTSSAAVAPPASLAVAPAPAETDTAPAALPVDVRVARYDSLLQAQAAAFDPLVQRLDAATPSTDVRSAIDAWRARAATPEQRARLHSALVQLLLRDVRPGIGIDGRINRDPCGGASCPALLEAWRRDASDLGYRVPPEPSARQIGIAERLLVLRALEAS